MTTRFRRSLRRGLAATLAVATLGLAGTSSANVFSLDDVSPSAPADPGLFLDFPGPGAGPFSTLLTLGDLGLVSGDRIDALSSGHDVMRLPYGQPVVRFGVSRPTAGLPGTGVRFERLVDTGPGGAAGHAADIFTKAPGAATNALAPAGFGWRGGTGTGDEANTGLIAGASPIDHITCLDDVQPEPTQQPVFFSLTPGSPTLASIGAGPDDILVVGGAYGPSPSIWLDAADLGVPAGAVADMDALALKVVFNAAGFAAPRMIAFSLEPAPAINLGGVVTSGGAQVLMSRGLGSSVLGWDAPQLGLRPEDDIDALDFNHPTPGWWTPQGD